jgi:O-antigen/teichoic acid export membrane protein
VVLYKSKVFAFVFKTSNLTKRLTGIMIKFGSAYFLSAVLNIIAKTNDTLIIASQSAGGLVDTAIFTIATYLITVMDVPQRSLISASILQISEAWKNHDMEKLDRLYKKTALNLLIFAAGIMGVIIINSSLLLHILGPTYKLLPMLMVILGFSKLIDLGTGLNSQILQLSKHWRIDLFTNMFFVVISIILNYFLTRKFGIIGTAVGGLIAIICYNLIRFVYIKRIYKLQPFTYKNALTIGAASILMGVTYFIPTTQNIWVDGIIKTILFSISFAFFIIKFNVSIDLTELYQSLLKKIKR